MTAAAGTSLAGGIWRAYRDPRGAMAREIALGLSDARALLHLGLACVLYFVASVPAALERARALSMEDAVSAVVAAHLFGYLFVAPLIGYVLAAAIHLVARAFGGTGGFLGARAALFWSALLGAPLALALAALDASAGGRLLPWLAVLGYGALAFWLWLLAASLAEAEGFAATGRVAAVLGLAFVGSAGALAMLARGVGAA